MDPHSTVVSRSEVGRAEKRPTNTEEYNMTKGTSPEYSLASQTSGFSVNLIQDLKDLNLVGHTSQHSNELNVLNTQNELAKLRQERDRLRQALQHQEHLRAYLGRQLALVKDDDSETIYDQNSNCTNHKLIQDQSYHSKSSNLEILSNWDKFTKHINRRTQKFKGTKYLNQLLIEIENLPNREEIVNGLIEQLELSIEPQLTTNQQNKNKVKKLNSRFDEKFSSKPVLSSWKDLTDDKSQSKRDHHKTIDFRFESMNLSKELETRRCMEKKINELFELRQQIGHLCTLVRKKANDENQQHNSYTEPNQITKSTSDINIPKTTGRRSDNQSYYHNFNMNQFSQHKLIRSSNNSSWNPYESVCLGTPSLDNQLDETKNISNCPTNSTSLSNLSDQSNSNRMGSNREVSDTEMHVSDLKNYQTYSTENTSCENVSLPSTTIRSLDPQLLKELKTRRRKIRRLSQLIDYLQANQVSENVPVESVQNEREKLNSNNLPNGSEFGQCNPNDNSTRMGNKIEHIESNALSDQNQLIDNQTFHTDEKRQFSTIVEFPPLVHGLYSEQDEEEEIENSKSKHSSLIETKLNPEYSTIVIPPEIPGSITVRGVGLHETMIRSPNSEYFEDQTAPEQTNINQSVNQPTENQESINQTNVPELTNCSPKLTILDRLEQLCMKLDQITQSLSSNHIQSKFIPYPFVDYYSQLTNISNPIPDHLKTEFQIPSTGSPPMSYLAPMLNWPIHPVTFTNWIPTIQPTGHYIFSPSRFTNLSVDTRTIGTTMSDHLTNETIQENKKTQDENHDITSNFGTIPKDTVESNNQTDIQDSSFDRPNYYFSIHDMSKSNQEVNPNNLNYHGISSKLSNLSVSLSSIHSSKPELKHVYDQVVGLIADHDDEPDYLKELFLVLRQLSQDLGLRSKLLTYLRSLLLRNRKFMKNHSSKQKTHSQSGSISNENSENIDMSDNDSMFINRSRSKRKRKNGVGTSQTSKRSYEHDGRQSVPNQYTSRSTSHCSIYLDHISPTFTPTVSYTEAELRRLNLTRLENTKQSNQGPESNPEQICENQNQTPKGSTSSDTSHSQPIAFAQSLNLGDTVIHCQKLQQYLNLCRNGNSVTDQTNSCEKTATIRPLLNSTLKSQSYSFNMEQPQPTDDLSVESQSSGEQLTSIPSPENLRSLSNHLNAWTKYIIRHLIRRIKLLNTDSLHEPLRMNSLLSDWLCDAILNRFKRLVDYHQIRNQTTTTTSPTKCTILGLLTNMDKLALPNPEFTLFFFKQLTLQLHEATLTYEGRILNDCLEDLMVDLSDILNEELAFFALMTETKGYQPIHRILSQSTISSLSDQGSMNPTELASTDKLDHDMEDKSNPNVELMNQLLNKHNVSTENNVLDPDNMTNQPDPCTNSRKTSKAYDTEDWELDTGSDIGEFGNSNSKQLKTMTASLNSIITSCPINIKSNNSNTNTNNKQLGPVKISLSSNSGSAQSVEDVAEEADDLSVVGEPVYDCPSHIRQMSCLDEQRETIEQSFHDRSLVSNISNQLGVGSDLREVCDTKFLSDEDRDGVDKVQYKVHTNPTEHITSVTPGSADLHVTNAFPPMVTCSQPA